MRIITIVIEPRREVAANETESDSRWFREPTPREHRIGAALFLGFGVFFLLLFVIQRGWWFRWVIAFLAVLSLVRGLRHALRAARG